MSSPRRNRKCKIRKPFRPSLFGSHHGRSASDRLRGLRLEPLEERRLLAVDTVTSSLDDGSSGTLRSVIGTAAAGDTIEFDLPSGTTEIDLTQGPIEISKDIAIQGPGASSLAIVEDYGGTPTILNLFRIDATDGGGNTVSVSLSKLTLSQKGLALYGSSPLPDPESSVYNAGTLSLDEVAFSGNVWGAFDNAGTADVSYCLVSNNNSGIRNTGILQVSDSTLTDNRGGYGGGINNGYNAEATVTRCIITNNSVGGSSSSGGGVYNQGTMTIVDSTISQNVSEASLGGGGVSNQGRMTIQGSTISGNQTDGGGGNGIYNRFGTLTVTDCTISNNSFAPVTYESDGGGIRNDSGRLYVLNSTIVDNFAKGNGGGIESDNGAFSVIDSTITGNTATDSGGGLVNNEGNGVVFDSTIFGNSAANQAGGLKGNSNDGSSETYLANTIVAGNLALGGDPDVQGDFSDSVGLLTGGPSDHDLIGIVGDATGFVASGVQASLVGTTTNPVEAKLGPLADNGGPTETMAPLSGSPAIDSGDNVPAGISNLVAQFNSSFALPTTDQRGVTRILNGTIDIGAFEVSRVAASASGNYTLKIVPGTSANQAQREILDPGNNVVFTSPVNMTPALILANTGGYTVNLTVDYSAGDPIPAGGLTFAGGGNDSLTVTGYSTDTLTDTYSGAHNGNVQIGAGASITYSGLAPLALDGTESNLVVNLPGGAASVTFQDDGTPGNGTSQMVSQNGTLEATTFTDPTSSVTVNAGTGGDTITVARNFTTDFNDNLSLNGGAGDDTFNVYATPASGPLTINGGGSVNGDVLNDFTPGDAEVWSDAGSPPVVTLDSSGQQTISFTSIQQVNVTPGNGTVNVYGDNDHATTSQNDGYQVVGIGLNAFTLALNGNNANATGYSQPINFSAVRTLNVYGEAKGTTGAHSDANTLAITPYADNTPQGWGVQAFWNQGSASAAGTLAYNGIPGVSENIAVAPSGQGSGQINSLNSATNTPVAVVSYTQNPNIVVNGSNGSEGETDTLTLKGGNPSAAGSGQFAADFATPGSTGPNLRVSDAANGNTLYVLQGFSNIGPLNLVAAGASSQNTLLIDGYSPATGQSGALDASLTVGEDRSSSTEGVVSVFQSQPPGNQYPEINYSDIGTLNVNSASSSSVEGPSIAFGSPDVANSGLQGTSDTGIAGQPTTLADLITADSTPTFYGAAQAGALVQLYVDMNGNGKVDSGDVFIGETTATAAGAQPNGQWTITSTVNLNNPKFGFAHDGTRTLLALAEDGAGDVSSPQSLTILLDTQGPQIGNVSVTGKPNYNLFLNEEPTPTPLVNSLNVTFTNPVTRSGGFVFPAVNQALATTAANYQLVGRTNGVIPITSVTFTDNTTAGGPGTSVATLHFATPLPDDYYTLNISDNILDNAGNAMAGAFNGSSFPTGNGSPGSSFTGSFVVNSHPHLAVANNSSISFDINGDGTFNPSNTVPDSDVVETFGLPNDQIFSGKFASSSGTVSGFDQLGAYGFVNGQWRWLLNLNPAQGTSNPSSFAETLSIKGQATPVAGYFAGNRTLGMQVGLFDNGTWYLDVLNHHTIDAADVAAGGQLKGNMKGTPIVGDFDGDGKTDLATYQNGIFEFDLSSKDPGGKLTGNFNATINATALIPALNYTGLTATPVAADLDGDGITDLGLYVIDPPSNGPGNGPGGNNSTTTNGLSQWYWLVSNDVADAGGAKPASAFASLNHAFNPAPLGHDLSYQYGDSSGVPLVGIWDPPTSALATSSNTTPSTGYVPALYANVLGRQPASGEVTYWNEAIANGQVTNSQAAQTFLESSEHLSPIIDGYYEQYLGRAADPAGLSYWIGVWQANGGPEQVQAGIIGSPEYYATASKLYPNLSPDAAWVTALYNNLLSRDPDSQGLAYWTNYIQRNAKQSVVLGFVTSDEYRLGLIDGWFGEYLGRAADSQAEQYWLGQMAEGVTQDQVQVALLASDEFVNRSQAG